MCRRVLLAMALAGFTCSSMAESWKEAVDATWHAPQPANLSSPLQASDMKHALGSIASDLDFDQNFATAGKAIYYLDYPSALIGQGLRIYAMDAGAGWYALAAHKRQDGYWDAAVIKVRPNGLQDKVYLIQTPLKQINDAVWDRVTRKFYFAGAGHAPALPGLDNDFAVTCVDIDSTVDGSTCSGFGNGGSGTAYVAFNLGASNHDFVTRVVVRPNIGLLLVGTAELTDHQDVIAVASLYRASGALVNSFGSNGRFYTALLSNPPLHADVNVFDAALSNDADAQTRLYIAGNFSRDDALRDYDGYVIALKAMTGIIDDASFNPGSGAQWVTLSLGDCNVNCRDAVTAINVQANGKLSVAGWSTDVNLNQQVMLGRLNVNGSFDTGFKGAGLFSATSGSHYYLSGSSGFVIPKAIAERPDTRDWVVAMDVRQDNGATTPAFQVLGQWPANARAEIAGNSFGFASDPSMVPWSTGAALLVDADSAMLIGTRRWSSTDDDVTVLRTLTNDTIFADMFGGPASD